MYIYKNLSLYIYICTRTPIYIERYILIVTHTHVGVYMGIPYMVVYTSTM